MKRLLIALSLALTACAHKIGPLPIEPHVDIDPELIDCPGASPLPGPNATQADLARWIAKNWPVLVECGADAQALRALQDE